MEGFISVHSLRVGSAVSLCEASDVGVVVAGGVVVEAAIGIELFAGELPSIIACACFISDSTEDIVRITDKDVLVVID